MLNTRTVAILLAATVAVTGVLLCLQAGEEAGTVVVLNVDRDQVTPPGEIRGVAQVPPDGDVEVTATVDGVDIDGSPDLDMEGAANEFSFPVGEELRGKTVVITATAADGTKSVRHVQVN